MKIRIIIKTKLLKKVLQSLYNCIESEIYLSNVGDKLSTINITLPNYLKHFDFIDHISVHSDLKIDYFDDIFYQI